MIKEFKVVATFEKEMIIKIDADIITDEWMKNFSSYMWHIDEHSELCEHIAHSVLFRDDNFVEGLGEVSQWTQDGNMKQIGVSVANVKEISEEFDVEQVITTAMMVGK